MHALLPNPRWRVWPKRLLAASLLMYCVPWSLLLHLGCRIISLLSTCLLFCTSALNWVKNGRTGEAVQSSTGWECLALFSGKPLGQNDEAALIGCGGSQVQSFLLEGNFYDCKEGKRRMKVFSGRDGAQDLEDSQAIFSLEPAEENCTEGWIKGHWFKEGEIALCPKHWPRPQKPAFIPPLSAFLCVLGQVSVPNFCLYAEFLCLISADQRLTLHLSS